MPPKKFKRQKDPHAKREASRYSDPISSREHILAYLKDYAQPASRDHIQKVFKLNTEQQQEALRRRLIAMVRDGQLLQNRRNSFALVEQCQLLKGRVQLHKDGFGFVLMTNGSDIFLPPNQVQHLCDGDKVLVRVADGGDEKKRTGSVVEILARAHEDIVGKLREQSGVYFVDPTDKTFSQSILIAEDATNGAAQPGQYVSVEILAYPSKRKQAMGKISEILGDDNTSGLEIEVALRNHHLPRHWSEGALAEVAELPETVDASAYPHRLDLRKLPFVTIDGESAQDYDDAVYVEGQPDGGWHLYVAIADVSHYLPTDSELDQAARERATSVYFPGQVIPMLPEALSNHLCSLLPQQDRLALVAECYIDKNGELSDASFHQAIIHSHARLTYTQVWDMLEGKAEAPSWWSTPLNDLYALFHALHRSRRQRGAIEFETTETQIEFTPEGKIAAIVPTTRNDAHRIIEECMLTANVATAAFLDKHNQPILHRVHASPEADRLADLQTFLGPFGFKLSGGQEPHGKDYNQLLKKIKGRQEAELIQTVLLRSLPQAIYQPDNIGHFGLAYQAYCHFTSPIRRYPDLLVHRAICQVLHGDPTPDLPADQSLSSLGEHCSMAERRADIASRDATDWLKCHYMQDKLGETYSGTVVSVTGFGIFVRLDSVYVEGLVHITSLPNDYYEFDRVHQRLIGRRGGKVFRLGDKLKVRVIKVDLDDQKLDFELVQV